MLRREPQGGDRSEDGGLFEREGVACAADAGASGVREGTESIREVHEAGDAVSLPGEEADRGVQELVDFDGARYDCIDGDAELADGLVVLPTPGHSPGHQSLVVLAQDGTLLVAGQLMDFSMTTQAPLSGDASAYASAHLARRMSSELGRPLAPWPDWLDRIEHFDPKRVVFAHDGATFAPIIRDRPPGELSPSSDLTSLR